MLQKSRVKWKENGHVRGGQFNGGRMVMLERWTYVYFIVFYGQSVVFCFLYTVYLTFKSPHLPLPLHQCFPPHCRIFAYRGEGELYACKNRASMSKQRSGHFNEGRMIMLQKSSV